MVPTGEDLEDLPCCSLVQDVEYWAAWYGNLVSLLSSFVFSQLCFLLPQVDQLYGLSIQSLGNLLLMFRQAFRGSSSSTQVK